MKHYIGNRAESYIYWNMILPPDGVSTGRSSKRTHYRQSDRAKIIKSGLLSDETFSSFIKGAIRLGIQGDMAADSLIFIIRTEALSSKR